MERQQVEDAPRLLLQTYAQPTLMYDTHSQTGHTMDGHKSKEGIAKGLTESLFQSPQVPPKSDLALVRSGSGYEHLRLADTVGRLDAKHKADLDHLKDEAKQKMEEMNKERKLFDEQEAKYTSELEDIKEKLAVREEETAHTREMLRRLSEEVSRQMTELQRNEREIVADGALLKEQLKGKTEELSQAQKRLGDLEVDISGKQAQLEQRKLDNTVGRDALEREIYHAQKRVFDLKRLAQINDFSNPDDRRLHQAPSGQNKEMDRPKEILSTSDKRALDIQEEPQGREDVRNRLLELENRLSQMQTQLAKRKQDHKALQNK
jgi:chromosome segregation ATPase